MSLTSFILNSLKSEKASGEFRFYTPDLILLPDYAVSLYADELLIDKSGVFPPDRVIVTADHFSPPSTVERAEILSGVKRVCEKKNWHLSLFEGICHQLLIEDERSLPGTLIIGSDSHTCTAGALGALSMGFGSTDVYSALVYGRIALSIPEAIRVLLTGEPDAWIMGHDIALELFRRTGPDALNRIALEFEDRTPEGISQDDRFTICNMMAEAGVNNALFLPDRITAEYLRKRGQLTESSEGIMSKYERDRGNYKETIEIDLSGLRSLAAMPPDPFNVLEVEKIGGLELDQVFIGSCASGRINDFAVVSGILSGKTVAPGLKAIAAPSSRRVLIDALDKGYVRSLLSAGVTILNPGCGPCGAIDKGLLASGERCAATINRNYKGRMGAPDADIYILSPAVAASSILTGRITSPGSIV